MYCKVRLFNFANNGVTLTGSQPEGLDNLSNRACEDMISLCWGRQHQKEEYLLLDKSKCCTWCAGIKAVTIVLFLK
jgi:hypothetical protein